MKILFPFVGDTVGGSHIATCLLIKYLNKHSDHRAIVTLHQKGALENYLRQNDIEYDFLSDETLVTEGNFFLQLLRMLKNIKFLGAFLKRNSIDIVHTNDLRMHFTWILPAFSQKNVRHIWHQHSRTSSWRLTVLSFFTDRILTISDYCKSSFPGMFQRKTEIIYNPFEAIDPLRKSKNIIRKELGIPEADKIIGFVGNFTSQKRPDFFIDVAKGVYKKQKDEVKYHFVLIGEKRDPIYTQLKKRLDKTPVKSCVHFLGGRYPVDPYIQDMDILIAPALKEGLGRTVIEGMLCSTPVIASDDGGHKEIITNNETGFLLEPNSIDDFVECIFNIFDNPVQAQHITQAAQKNAQERFSIERYIEKIITHYRMLVS